VRKELLARQFRVSLSFWGRKGGPVGRTTSGCKLKNYLKAPLHENRGGKRGKNAGLGKGADDNPSSKTVLQRKK